VQREGGVAKRSSKCNHTILNCEPSKFDCSLHVNPPRMCEAPLPDEGFG
jgi:hypothetical protein